MKDDLMSANDNPSSFSQPEITPVPVHRQSKINIQILPVPLQLKVRVQEHAHAPAYAVKTEDGWLMTGD